MIVEYRIGYPRINQWSTCCGRFRDWDHFRAFVAIEATYGRTISHPREI